MGCLIRLLASLVRSGIVLVLAGGILGCSTCPSGGPLPLPAAPSLIQTAYHAAEPSADKGLSDALGMPGLLAPGGTHPQQILAVSGGVAGAPFTAGVLVGWTKTGTRPTFDQVTGISSGSLIGAYAFLGPKYDAPMRHLILTLNTADLIKFRPLHCMLWDGAFGSGKPAERLIRRVYDDCFMDDLRHAYAEGRRLFVGTMNLETRRLAVWDLGAIASSGRPDADELVRKVLLAAVSWPGAVPPVAFDIEVNGRCYREEHCDAGSVAMVLPPLAPMSGCPAGSDIYVLASRKLYPEPVCVRKSAICRLKPCIAAFFEALTRDDICRVHSLCLLCGARFHLLALPQIYHGEPPSLTNLYPKEAPKLFATGYQLGVSGPCWRFTPPGAEAGEEIIPYDGRGIHICH
jgi:predicted acylesterase/phospholipase RssA